MAQTTPSGCVAVASASSACVSEVDSLLRRLATKLHSGDGRLSEAEERSIIEALRVADAAALAGTQRELVALAAFPFVTNDDSSDAVLFEVAEERVAAVLRVLDALDRLAEGPFDGLSIVAASVQRVASWGSGAFESAHALLARRKSVHHGSLGSQVRSDCGDVRFSDDGSNANGDNDNCDDGDDVFLAAAARFIVQGGVASLAPRVGDVVSRTLALLRSGHVDDDEVYEQIVFQALAKEAPESGLPPCLEAADGASEGQLVVWLNGSKLQIPVCRRDDIGVCVDTQSAGHVSLACPWYHGTDPTSVRSVWANITQQKEYPYQHDFGGTAETWPSFYLSDALWLATAVASRKTKNTAYVPVIEFDAADLTSAHGECIQFGTASDEWRRLVVETASKDTMAGPRIGKMFPVAQSEESFKYVIGPIRHSGRGDVNVDKVQAIRGATQLAVKIPFAGLLKRVRVMYVKRATFMGNRYPASGAYRRSSSADAAAASSSAMAASSSSSTAPTASSSASS